MSRIIGLVGVLLALLIAAPAAQAQRDWRANVTRTSAGDYVIGNPAAKVSLTEYISFTCPACRLFVEQSSPALRGDLVRRGVVRVEIRNMTLNGLDMAAAMLARCAGPGGFVPMHDLIYANQSALIDRAGRIRPAFLAGSPTDQAKAFAAQSGLADLAKSRGMTDAGIDQCLSNQAELDRLSAATQAALPRIHGTPGFEINGKLAHDVHNWAALRPLLAAAGAK